jgi:hypothetical protein
MAEKQRRKLTNGREESSDRNSDATSDQCLLFYLESISVFKEERRNFISKFFQTQPKI